MDAYKSTAAQINASNNKYLKPKWKEIFFYQCLSISILQTRSV